jgi:uncharacterized SAM-binding protein YcdF (DUF218 family)
MGAAAAAVLGVWLCGLIVFGEAIPREVADRTTRTDAIVVLTGGSERLRTGVRLLAENKAERLFVTGVHPAVDPARLLQVSGDAAPGLADRIDAGHEALDTSGNADEVRGWMRHRGYRTLRLVTSGYHMPRSLLEFSRALPDAVVIPHPVFSARLDHENWWQSPRTAIVVISEFNKYLLARVAHGLGNAPNTAG